VKNGADQLGDLYWADTALHDPQKAFDAYQQAADAGNTGSLIKLAKAWLSGDGPSLPANPETAFKYYQEAAGLGDSTATIRVGEMMARGEGTTQSYVAGRLVVSGVASTGNANAFLSLGDLNANVSGGPVNGPAAVAAYEQAAQLGNATAMMRLAQIYTDGKLVPTDAARAVRYYNAAATAGYPTARTALAVAYLNGKLKGHNQSEGLSILQADASQHLSAATLALSDAYLNGTGVPRDTPRALAVLADALRSGDTAAGLRLVTYYRDGRPPSIRQNEAKARSYLQQLTPRLDPRNAAVQPVLLAAAFATSKAGFSGVFSDLMALARDDRRAAATALSSVNFKAFVFALQTRFAQIGLFSSSPSGTFTSATQRAMVEYCHQQDAPDSCATDLHGYSAAVVFATALM